MVVLRFRAEFCSTCYCITIFTMIFRIDVEGRKIAVSIWTMFTLFVNLSETMDMLSVQCFQYLCITTLYLFTGITLVNKMEQLERKIEAVESRKDQIMYQTYFLVLKAKFFNDFCQQDPSKMERTFTLRIQQSVTERQGNTERQGKVDIMIICFLLHNTVCRH
jgi:hypothetical protein